MTCQNKLSIFNENISGANEKRSQCTQTVENSSLPVLCFGKADILLGDVLWRHNGNDSSCEDTENATIMVLICKHF